MLNIREGTRSDVKEILNLIKELALFEKAPEQVINTEEAMLTDGFGSSPLFQSFVAEKITDSEKKIIGAAICYQAYSTWKGKYIYLDDIIVTETERRSGAGTLLFDRVIEYARSVDANQLRWHVLNWNTPAINFYKKYSCTFDEEWITCKIEKRI